MSGNYTEKQSITQSELARRCGVGRRRVEVAIQRREISAECIGQGPQGVTIADADRAESQLRAAMKTVRTGRPPRALAAADANRTAEQDAWAERELLGRRSILLCGFQDATRNTIGVEGGKMSEFLRRMTAVPAELARKLAGEQDEAKATAIIDNMLGEAALPMFVALRRFQEILEDWGKIHDVCFPEPYKGADWWGDFIRKHVGVKPRTDPEVV